MIMGLKGARDGVLVLVGEVRRKTRGCLAALM